MNFIQAEILISFWKKYVFALTYYKLVVYYSVSLRAGTHLWTKPTKYLYVNGVCELNTNVKQTACHKPKFVGLLCEHKGMFVHSVDGFLAMIHFANLKAGTHMQTKQFALGAWSRRIESKVCSLSKQNTTRILLFLWRQWLQTLIQLIWADTETIRNK